MFKKIFLGLLFLGYIHTFAQTHLHGTVTNENKEPLMGVEVYVEDLQKGTSTDENGKYELINLPKSQFRITVAYIGYESQTQIVNLQQNDLLVDFILKESVFKMDEIIVSTAFNKLQSQNVMKVEHESIKTLEAKGCATLIEGLTSMPGINQISTGTSIGKPVIRGLSGNRVLVYSQGVRLENQQFGDEHGLGLNESGVESVEVIKGPASLLYGSDALGGVLYFNPEKFAEIGTFHTDFSQKYFSNTMGSSSSLGLKTSSNHWRFLARGSYDTHSDYQISKGSRVTNTRFNETDVKTGIGFNNSKFSSILRYNFNRLDLGIPEEGIAAQSQSKTTEFPRQGVQNNLISLNNVVYFQNSKLDVDLGFIANDRSEFEDSDEAVLHMKLNTLNYNAKYYLPKFGKIETIFGIQGMNQTNKNSGEEYLIPNATTYDFGVYGTANYEWKSTVIQAGLRFDARSISSDENGLLGDEGYFAPLDRSYNSFNTSLGFKTNLNEDMALRLNVATGFRAPNLAELTSNGVHEGTNRYEVGNNNLNTEQNLQTDLNLAYNKSHFEFFVGAFYNHVNHYIYASPSGSFIDDNEVYNYVQNNTNLYGGEIGIHLHPHPLDWLHLESSFETVTGVKQNGDYLPLIPANNWNNTLRSEFDINNWLSDGFVSINVSSTFKQDLVSGVETPSTAYTLTNIGLGGTLHFSKINFDIRMNANNIFDIAYISHLSRLKIEGIQNMGRNFVLSLKIPIAIK